MCKYTMWCVFNVIQGNSVGIKKVKRSNCAKYCNNHSMYYIGLAKKLLLFKKLKKNSRLRGSHTSKRHTTKRKWLSMFDLDILWILAIFYCIMTLIILIFWLTSTSTSLTDCRASGNGNYFQHIWLFTVQSP